MSSSQIWKYGFELALQVYEKSGRSCHECGSKETLSIHHIDGSGNYPSPNNNLENLLLLCQSCHGRLHAISRWEKQGRRQEWSIGLTGLTIKEYNKKYNEENTERRKEKNRQYYEQNRAAFKERAHKYYLKHTNVIKTKSAEWQKGHGEQRRVYMQNYKKKRAKCF